uniref:Uncharacterized protein n=1 Tax=Solanum lycopersicum TaxID=4081 RepID=A0A3Q7IY25_SOLLC
MKNKKAKKLVSVFKIVEDPPVSFPLCPALAEEEVAFVLLSAEVAKSKIPLDFKLSGSNLCIAGLPSVTADPTCHT